MYQLRRNLLMIVAALILTLSIGSLIPCKTQAAKSKSKAKTESTDSTDSTEGAEEAKEERALEEWLNVCRTMGINMKKKGFRYSYSGSYRSYGAALSGRRKTNCAQFVSWCLQEYNILAKGQTYYVSRSRIKKNFSSWDKDKVDVIKVFKKCSKANLQPGDVVCWAGRAHTCIYAGRNSKGNRTWFDAGRQSTYGKRNGSKFKTVSASTNSYLDGRKIAYIIRIKDL